MTVLAPSSLLPGFLHLYLVVKHRDFLVLLMTPEDAYTQQHLTLSLCLQPGFRFAFPYVGFDQATNCYFIIEPMRIFKLVKLARATENKMNI